MVLHGKEQSTFLETDGEGDKGGGMGEWTPRRTWGEGGELGSVGRGGRTESRWGRWLDLMLERAFLPNEFLFSQRGERKWAGVWEVERRGGVKSGSEGALTQARGAESEAVGSRFEIRCRESQTRSVCRWGVPPPGTSSWSGRVEGAVTGLSQDGAFSTEYPGRGGEARREGFFFH